MWRRVAVCGAVLGWLLIPAVGLGLEISGAAENATSTTFHACLKAGTLSGVSMSSHACPAGAQAVSWGESGPKGSQGPPGPTVNTCAALPGPGLNFSTCTLTTVVWDYVDLSGSLMNEANLSGAEITHADLDGVNLSGASLGATDLNYSTFVGGTFTNTDLHAAALAGADFQGDNLSVDLLYQAALPQANLSHANLTQADFNSADLTSANLTGANLTGADFDLATTTGATVTGARWSDTTCPDGTNSSSYSPQTCVGHGF